MIENGGKPQRVTTTLGYTKEQSSAIQMLINGKDNYERIGLHYGASRYVYSLQQYLYIDTRSLNFETDYRVRFVTVPI